MYNQNDASALCFEKRMRRGRGKGLENFTRIVAKTFFTKIIKAMRECMRRMIDQCCIYFP